MGVLHGRWPTPILLLLGALLSVPVVWLMMRGEDRPGSIVMAVVAYSVTLGVVLEYRKHRRVSEA
ncbi:MAG: hypothetical protein LWW86_09670 [Micrococcales bacterium]|nr:hypothetical protein [Micrococcales bacterium]